MTKANLDPAVAALERALLSWHDLAALGQHSYAQMALAEERLRNDQTPDTLHNRGLALQNVLAAALEQLKPTSEHRLSERETRAYTILVERYRNRRTTQAVAGLVGLSAAQYYRWQRAALKLLWDKLWEMEQAAARRLSVAAELEPSADALIGRLALGLRTEAPRVSQFVGRRADLQSYADRLAVQHAVAIVGPAGIGKTSLAAELVTNGYTGARRLLWYDFLPDRSISIDVLLQALGEQLVAWNVPDARLILGRRDQNANDLGQPGRVQHLLRVLQSQPFVVCFDNIELALTKPAIVGFLKELWDTALRSKNLRVLLVGLDRPPFVFGQGDPTLGGLNPGDAQEFLTRLAMPEFRPELWSELYALTQGNPMWLELFALWVTQNVPDPADDEALSKVERFVHSLWRVPDIAQYLLTRVYRRLKKAQRKVLEFASLFREPFDDEDTALVDILARAGVNDVQAAVQSLLALHLLARPRDDQTRIAAPVIRGYFYSQVKGRRSEAVRLHREVAIYYETRRQNLIEAAHHWYESGEHRYAALLMTEHLGAGLYAGQARQMLDILNRFNEDELDSDVWNTVQDARGDALALVGEADAAMQVYRSSLARAEAAATPRQSRRIAMLCHRLGRVQRKGDQRQALGWYKRGLEGLNNTNEDSDVAAGIYIDGAGVLYQQADYEESETWCLKGLALLPAESAAFWRARGENFLGHAYYRRGDLTHARQHYQAALDMSRLARDDYHASMSYTNLANVLLDLGNVTEALNDYKESIRLKERIGDSLGLANVMFNLGSLYTERGDDAEALSYLGRCRTIWARSQSPYAVAAADMNTAIVYIEREEWATAVSLLARSLATLRQVRGRRYWPEVFRLAAQIRLGQGALSRAEHWANRSLSEATAQGMPHEIALTHRVRGMVYTAEGRWDEGEAELDKALRLADALRDPYALGRAHYAWGLHCLARRDAGDDQAALVAHAQQHFQRAADLFARIDAKRDLARAQTYLS